MVSTQGRSSSLGNNEAEVVLALADFIASATSHEELCQRLIHEPVFSQKILGAKFFRVRDDSALDPETGCGTDILPNDQPELKALVEDALRSRNLSYLTGLERAWLVIPIHKGWVPLAILVLSINKDWTIDDIVLRAVAIATRFAYFFYCFVPRKSREALKTSGLPIDFELSERHHLILKLLAQGLSNKEISKAILISESTIRQENVKIFKYLGAKNRTEAVLLSQPSSTLD